MQSSSQIITTNKTTPSFLHAGCPCCRPTNSVKALKGKYHIPWTCLPQAHLGVFQLCLWPLIAPGYLGGVLPCLLSALLYTPTTWFSSWPKNKHSSNRHHSWTRVVQGPPANATVNGSADTLDFQLKTKNTGSLVHVSQWSDIISHEQSAVQSQTMITMISTAWHSCSEQNRTYTHYSLHQNKSKTDCYIPWFARPLTDITTTINILKLVNNWNMTQQSAHASDYLFCSLSAGGLYWHTKAEAYSKLAQYVVLVVYIDTPRLRPTQSWPNM